ncbi:MAG: coproporphyrinogen III oxidase family protein [Verrucomicrobia bacterium]|nr:coproporphyrinogen III oxidase family protein [Verrucomicrobiota bacterium]
MILPVDKPIESLYVHVPFCAHKCEYCAFFSEAAEGALINRYVAALIRELEFVAADLRPRTIFFGGGTPSLLNLRQWEQILAAMQRLGLASAEEWTVECNPATVSLDKAKLLRAAGVNRISMGVQSLDENLLDRLGRVHSREMVFRSFDILRAAGFANLNLDLMFAIPGQTVANFARTTSSTPDGVPSFACQHNINYWRGGYYHGLGPSAAGYVRGVRTKNWANTQLYCEQLEKGKRAIESREELPPLRRAGEIAAFGLRMNVGWPFQQFAAATGFDLPRDWSREMNQLVDRGWGRREPDRFHLTASGLRFADAAAEMFLR